MELCSLIPGAALLYPFLGRASLRGVPGLRDWLVICNFVVISEFCVFGCYDPLSLVGSVRCFLVSGSRSPWVMSVSDCYLGVRFIIGSFCLKNRDPNFAVLSIHLRRLDCRFDGSRRKSFSCCLNSVLFSGLGC